ncbi:MAG: HD domain-containing phosphohydrolase [Phycisphaerae bacterium]
MDTIGVNEALLTVLVADGDASSRRLCRFVLERVGHRVLEAADGEALVAAAIEHTPDIIVTSLRLTKLDGLEAIRRVRANPVAKDCLIIILSGNDDPSDIVAGLEAGADEYLVKPFRPKEFAVRVHSMSRLRLTIRELRRSHDMLGEQTRVLSLLLDFCGAIAMTEDLGQVVDRTVEAAVSLTGCRRVAILLPGDDQTTLRIERSVGIADVVNENLVVPTDRSISGTVLKTAKPIVFGNGTNENTFPGAVDAAWIGLPHAVMPMNAAEETIGVLHVSERLNARPFSDQEIEFISLVCSYAASAIQNIFARRAREAARDSIVTAMAGLAEHRDDDTGLHLDRMTGYCLILAEALRKGSEYADEIDASFLNDLRRAAPLHDIGKVAIPDHILLKPGRLTPDEMEIMRRHATIGADTIRSIRARSPDSSFLKMAEDIASGHHEWYDGNGYPVGVRGSDIPLSARIAAVADVYDALTSRRVYKDAIPHAKAQSIIVGLSGRQFDPVIVHTLLSHEAEIQALAERLADRTATERYGATAPPHTGKPMPPDDSPPAEIEPRERKKIVLSPMS